jgi:hypothetical protein
MAYDDFNNVVVLFGGYAGTYNGETWLYDVGNDTWTQKFPASSPSARWGHTMAYNSDNGLVYLFGGEDMGGFSAETWAYDVTVGPEGAWNFITDTGPTPRYFSAMSYDQPNTAMILYGGNDGVIQADTWALVGNSWIPKFPGPTTPLATFGHSATFCAGLGQALIFGGNDGSNDTNAIWGYDIADGPNGVWKSYIGVRAPEPVSFSSIVYDSDSKRLVTFGGDGGRIYNESWIVDYSTPWNGDIVTPAVGTNGENFTAVAWDNTGYNATMIGNDYLGDTGVIYSFYMGNYHVTKVPDPVSTLAGHRLYGIDFKPGKSSLQTAIIAGASGFQFHSTAVDQSTMVFIGAEAPNTLAIDLWEQSDPAQTSRLNDQVDVDAAYTFFVEANYTIGGADSWNFVEMNLTAWYDGGALGIGSGPPDATWTAEDARTRQFRLTYNVNNDTAWMSYPAGAPFEFSILNWWLDPLVYGGPGEFRHRMYINVTFENQTFSGNGNGFLNGPAFGGDIWTMNTALNDPSSWDFRVGVYDVTNTGAVNYSYEEFGINEMVSISVSGNPTRNAPPGSPIALMANPSIITYSCNLPYWVNVSLVDDLYLGGSPPGPMVGATNISVINVAPDAGLPVASDIAALTPFAGPGLINDLCIWGSSMPPGIPVNEPLNGTQTSGPWRTNYFTPGITTQVNWWAAVPAGIQEGMYWTVITIRIEG